MKLKKTLQSLTKAVLAEAERNPEFQQKLQEALGLNRDGKSASKTRRQAVHSSGEHRGANRRPPAVLDPIQLAHEGEHVLRDRLASLDIEELKDVVADYGMDPGKLVLKWKSPDRIIDRIVELSLGRARKGDAFRS